LTCYNNRLPITQAKLPAALLQEVAPGRWVFDKRCGCVGYKPQDISALDAPTGSQAVWFTVETTALHPNSGPYSLTCGQDCPLISPARVEG